VAATLSVGHLDLILKCAEVCNLNCSYCYYYNMGDDSWKRRPKKIGSDTLGALHKWLSDGIRDLRIDTVTVTLHGGEPLLLQPKELEDICAGIRATVAEAGATCRLSVQTNGVLIDAQWLDVFSRQDISVGVSIDGPPAVQDRYRVDKQGRGSSRAVENGVALLHSQPGIRSGSLSVIDPSLSGSEAYAYLRRLGFSWMDFLIPMDCYSDAPSPERVHAVGKFLADVAAAWFDDPKQDDVVVRIIDHYLRSFQQYAERVVPNRHPKLSGHAPIVVVSVHSDGTLGFREEVFNSGFGKNDAIQAIGTTSLLSFVNSSPFRQLEVAYSTVPEDCSSCEYLGVCGGGDPKNRFDPTTGTFANRSVYCEGLKLLFGYLIDRLVADGYPAHRIEAKLLSNASFLREVAKLS